MIEIQAKDKISPQLVLVIALFITCLVASNIVAVKIADIFGHFLPAAIIIFPVSYIIGDILTEVYGYSRARQVIWLGFFCNLFAVGVFWIGGLLPSAPFWEDQGAYETILGSTPRLLFASFIAYLIGELSNAAVLTKVKVWTSGRWLWIRTITSTIVGQGLDSAVFITVAFSGIIAGSDLIDLVLTQWVIKVLYEIGATPITYLVVGYLKRVEGNDHYDNGENFNPLPSLR